MCLSKSLLGMVKFQTFFFLPIFKEACIIFTSFMHITQITKPCKLIPFQLAITELQLTPFRNAAFKESRLGSDSEF